MNRSASTTSHRRGDDRSGGPERRFADRLRPASSIRSRPRWNLRGAGRNPSGPGRLVAGSIPVRRRNPVPGYAIALNGGSSRPRYPATGPRLEGPTWRQLARRPDHALAAPLGSVMLAGQAGASRAGRSGEQELEVYVVLGGSGSVKLDDEIRELRRWDVVRVAPATFRGFSAGPMGSRCSRSAPTGPRAATACMPRTTGGATR